MKGRREGKERFILVLGSRRLTKDHRITACGLTVSVTVVSVNNSSDGLHKHWTLPSRNEKKDWVSSWRAKMSQLIETVVRLWMICCCI